MEIAASLVSGANSLTSIADGVSENGKRNMNREMESLNEPATSERREPELVDSTLGMKESVSRAGAAGPGHRGLTQA